jgi:hypothetical protein
MSDPSSPDSLSYRERELVVRALRHLHLHENNLSEDEARMARRLIATLAPPPSIPDEPA